MRIRDQRAYDEPGIDLVPLIDVILVLIIFFVITTTFDVRSTLQLQLPVASPQAPPPARTLNIIVNADGRYFVGEREVLQTGIEAVKQAIVESAGEDRELPVMLRADARTPYQAVVTAQDALAQLGFRRIAIATAPETTSAASPEPQPWATGIPGSGRSTGACWVTRAATGRSWPRRWSGWSSRRSPAAASCA